MLENLTIVYTYRSDGTTPERDFNLSKSLLILSRYMPPQQILIVNFGNTHPEWEFICSHFTILDVNQTFSRGLGNNLGAEQCRTDYVFFLDADMLLFEDYFQDVVFSPGIAYFPICFVLARNKLPIVDPKNGRYGHRGFGMSLFHIEDFRRVGRFMHNTFWGREDRNLYRRAAKRLQIMRKETPYLIHLWHPTDKAYKNKFYQVEGG